MRALGALLGPALLLLLLPAPGSRAAGNPPDPVNGILGGSVLLCLKLPPAKPVKRTEWFFQTGPSPRVQIAEVTDGKLQQNFLNVTFSQRLEMAGETTLRIRALEKEDSGVLTASVLFATGEVHEQTFCLSLFEPLPDLQIHTLLISRTAEACNVTLQCLTSAKGSFNISWKSGNQLSILGEDSGWYRLSSTGTDLHLSWQPSSLDSTFTCELSNPVDQKNVSFDLLSICSREGTGERLSWVRVLMLVGVLVQIIIVALLNSLERTG